MKRMLGLAIVLGMFVGCGDAKSENNADNKSETKSTNVSSNQNSAKSGTPSAGPGKQNNDPYARNHPGGNPNTPGTNSPGGPTSTPGTQPGASTETPAGSAASNPFVKFFTGTDSKVKGK